jgi:alpha-beta hydrolase superfamily lysophospholipase/uncharacterized membrane protein HdeD (DUF308 family)
LSEFNRRSLRANYPESVIRRSSRWLTVVFAALAAAAGGILMVIAFSSVNALVLLTIAGMAVLGLLEFFAAGDADLPRAAIVAGFAWLTAAVVLAVWPGVTIGILSLAVGLGLIITGAVHVSAGMRTGVDQRITTIAIGATGVLLGVLVLSWPHITLLLLGFVFGFWLLFTGIAYGIRAVKAPHPWPRTVSAVVAVVVALALGAVGLQLHYASPRAGPFYAAPTSVPARPGVLLRSQSYGHSRHARAWRILYTSTRSDRTPAIASGIVVVADNAPAGPRPVVAWAHDTTGITSDCAPSVLDGYGGVPALDQVLARGWAVVAPDYTGLGTAGPHPYLIGQGEGRSVLDAVRAAKQIKGLSLADQTVVWGHSQGGHAALWTGMLAPSYAPDAHIAGVAALAPPSDLSAFVRNLAVARGGSAFASYVVRAYEEAYPDVRLNDYIRPTARIEVREMAGRCLAGSKMALSVLSTMMFDKTIWRADPAGGALGARLRENTPTGHIAAPLLIAQGEADPLVLTRAQSAYALAMCHSGQPVEYRKYPGEDHDGLVADGSPLIPDLLKWTQNRFDHEPHTATC